MSAGITYPCAYIDQPARALALGTAADRPTRSPAHASQRNNHHVRPASRGGSLTGRLSRWQGGDRRGELANSDSTAI